MADSQQIVAEHMLSIDTAAQHIDSINAVADMAAQLVAVAGMLPDVAATAQARADIRALAKKLGEVTRVAEALPLLTGLEALTAQVAAVLSMRPELDAVTGQMDAIRRLAVVLDTLVQAPEHAAKAKAEAEKALTASSYAEDEASAANTARLNAEFSEAEAKKAGAQAEVARLAAEMFSNNAQQAAAAAAAVSGLPDASQAAPGDPLIWNGTAFAVGHLADSLSSTEGTLGVSTAVLDTLTAAKEAADSSALVAEHASMAADEAKTIAEGVDAKATQAQSDAAIARREAEAAGAKADTFAGRMEAAETETLNIGTALGSHSANADIHTSKTALEAFVADRVSTGLNQIKGSGDGSALPENRSTLLGLSGAIDTVSDALADFLDSAEPGQRLAILAELDRLTTSAASGLTRGDVVNALTSDDAEAPLAAAQGKALAQQVATVKTQVEATTGRSWVGVVAEVPESWPENVHPDGLLLHCVMTDDSIVNPEWFVNTLNRPTRLVTDATGIRLADGTTVQSAVAQIKVDAAQASSAANSAATAAVQAQADAATALSTAQEALAKSPDLATQTTPGIVKGSSTVDIGDDGSVNVVGGAGGSGGGALVVSPPVITVPPQVGVGFPFDIQLTAGPVLLPGATVARYEVIVDEGEPVEVPAVDGAATYKFTPQGEPDTPLVVTAVAVDSMGNRSVAANTVTQRMAAFVAAPRLLAPAGKIFAASGVIFATSTFESVTTADTHESSRYRIIDSQCADIYDSGQTDTLTTHTMPQETVLTRGETYTFEAAHKGRILGWSNWGQSIVEVSTSRHGERLQGMATLIGNKEGNPFYVNGKHLWLAVPDAKFRPSGNSGVWANGSGESLPSGLSPLKIYAPWPYVTNTMTELEIDTLLAKEVNNSKHNTNCLIASGSPPASKCRNIKIGETPCDMPTIKILARIFQMRSVIDGFDPTLPSYPNIALAKWKPNTTYTTIWSSSANGAYNGATYTPSASIRDDGIYSVQPWHESCFGVIPVIEIEA